MNLEYYILNQTRHFILHVVCMYFIYIKKKTIEVLTEKKISYYYSCTQRSINVIDLVTVIKDDLIRSTKIYYVIMKK